MAGAEHRGRQPQELEGQQVVDSDRRKFLAKLVVGTTLLVGGGFEGTRSLFRLMQQGQEADSELKKRGIEFPEKGKLEAVRQLREDIANNPLVERNPDDLRKARTTEEQQANYLAARKRLLDDNQAQSGPSDKRTYGSFGVMAVGEFILLRALFGE
jgi:hypothetical protein